MRSVFAAFIQSHPFITLCFIGGFVSFVGISNELWTPDEPRDAAIGRAMGGVRRLDRSTIEWRALSGETSIVLVGSVGAVRASRSCDSNPRPAALRAIRLCRVAADLCPRPEFFRSTNLSCGMPDSAQHGTFLANDSLDRCR